MQTNDSNPLQQGKSQTSPHAYPGNAKDAGADEEQDAETSNAPNTPNDKSAIQPQRISREAAEKGIPPDADPDDPVSP